MVLALSPAERQPGRYILAGLGWAGFGVCYKCADVLRNRTGKCKAGSKLAYKKNGTTDLIRKEL